MHAKDWKIAYLTFVYKKIRGTRQLLHLAKHTDFETPCAVSFKAGFIAGARASMSRLGTIAKAGKAICDAAEKT